MSNSPPRLTFSLPSSSAPEPVQAPDVQNNAPPSISTLNNSDSNPPRRMSVQFLSNSKPAPTGGLPPRPPGKPRRMSSPPPPPSFRPRVSFDTFDKPADFIEENSFTLVMKHKDYEYTKRSRTFLCGLDSNEYSEFALEWLIDELIDDGDEIVCLRVVEKDSSLAEDRRVDNHKYRDEAEEIMRRIQTKNHDDRAINLILEFAIGKVSKVIDDMVNLYEPAILIVGTRGRSLGGFQGLLPGSISKYCLQHSPVPVIVVRPSSKRTKSKRKRVGDPSRHGYQELLSRTGIDGGHLLDSSHRNSLVDDTGPVSDDEAAAVAAAIGYKAPKERSPLGKHSTPTSPESEKSGYTGGSSPPSPVDGRSPVQLLKSPSTENLESPTVSDQSSDGDEGGGVGINVKETPVDSPEKEQTAVNGAEGQVSAESTTEKKAMVDPAPTESSKPEETLTQPELKETNDGKS